MGAGGRCPAKKPAISGREAAAASILPPRCAYVSKSSYVTVIRIHVAESLGSVNSKHGGPAVCRGPQATASIDTWFRTTKIPTHPPQRSGPALTDDALGRLGVSHGDRVGGALSHSMLRGRKSSMTSAWSAHVPACRFRKITNQRFGTCPETSTCWAAPEPMQPTPLLLSAEEGGESPGRPLEVPPHRWGEREQGASTPAALAADPVCSRCAAQG